MGNARSSKVAYRNRPSGPATCRKGCAFAAVVVGWVVLDLWSKSLFVHVTPGQVVAGPYFGLFALKLVHNTGGAWGIFAGSAQALGVFSLVVCAALTALFIVRAKNMGFVRICALALIVAGGIGNACDRLAQGYVVDFIAATFMDFPVFNIADIGVTCGVALLAASFAVEAMRSPTNAEQEARAHEGDVERPHEDGIS